MIIKTKTLEINADSKTGELSINTIGGVNKVLCTPYPDKNDLSLFEIFSPTMEVNLAFEHVVIDNVSHYNYCTISVDMGYENNTLVITVYDRERNVIYTVDDKVMAYVISAED